MKCEHRYVLYDNEWWICSSCDHYYRSPCPVDLTLARKTLDKYECVPADPSKWAEYHLAKDVLMLAGELPKETQ